MLVSCRFLLHQEILVPVQLVDDWLSCYGPCLTNKMCGEFGVQTEIRCWRFGVLDEASNGTSTLWFWLGSWSCQPDNWRETSMSNNILFPQKEWWWGLTTMSRTANLGYRRPWTMEVSWAERFRQIFLFFEQKTSMFLNLNFWVLQCTLAERKCRLKCTFRRTTYLQTCVVLCQEHWTSLPT